MKNYLADVVTEEDGVFDIDLVSKAANRAIFQNPCKSGLCSLGQNNEIVGLVLRPGQVIPRVDENGEEYTIQFSEDSIKRARESWVKTQSQLNAGLEHNENKLNNMTYLENWIVEDEKNDKANTYGFKAKKGEWYVKLLVENEEALTALKNEEVTGLSLEGDFTYTEIESETAERHNFNHMNIIEKLKALLAEEEKPEEKLEEVKAESEEVQAESEEVKAAMSPEEMEAAIIALQEAVAALTAPAEEAPAEEMAEEKKEDEEKMSKVEEAILSLDEKIQSLSAQLSEIPVADTIKREKQELSEDKSFKSIQEILNNKNQK